MTPFLTLYTPTYRRPQQLARCLESVRIQTAVSDIEHLVIPDHVGLGIGGMYGRIPQYAQAVHGLYVMVLCDDDELASPTVVEQVRDFAIGQCYPDVLLLRTNKGGRELPAGSPWPPRLGAIDLNCVMTKADVWRAHVQDYGQNYEGDYWYSAALAKAGHTPVMCDVLFSVGAVSRGAAEQPIVDCTFHGTTGRNFIDAVGGNVGKVTLGVRA